jgi:ABC-type glycerol-3-phosphate transport system substrate-binding protein
MMKVAMGQLKDTVPWVNFPGKNALQIEQVLLDIRAAILTGQKTPSIALKEAEDKINRLLP